VIPMRKKAQAGMSTAVAGLTSLAVVVILFVVIGMISAFGSDIVQDTSTDLLTATSGCNSTSVVECGQAYNNTISAQSGIGNITTKLPTLGTVMIGAFIILILVAAFGSFVGFNR